MSFTFEFYRLIFRFNSLSLLCVNCSKNFLLHNYFELKKKLIWTEFICIEIVIYQKHDQIIIMKVLCNLTHHTNFATVFQEQLMTEHSACLLAVSQPAAPTQKLLLLSPRKVLPLKENLHLNQQGWEWVILLLSKIK